jgi:hypothetical protein
MKVRVQNRLRCEFDFTWTPTTTQVGYARSKSQIQARYYMFFAFRVAKVFKRIAQMETLMSEESYKAFCDS